MSRAVAFVTPGLIDIRAFTTFGVNSKPLTQNPIGYFGTGLKYALAVLCRLGASPRLFIGRDEYTFYTKDQKFRDKEYKMVWMRRRKWSLTRATNHQLPFTTELGKNWEVWQAFRELEANTRDEGGSSVLTASFAPDAVVKTDHTIFVVENEAFVDAYLNKDTTFLPGGLSVREDGARVQVLDRPSRHLYYRGLRVADLQKPSIFTYNMLSEQTLTEDRTLKNQFMARADLARHFVTSQDRGAIERVLTATDGAWEHGLEWDYQTEPPSQEFQEVINRRRGAVPRAALRYYGGFSHLSSPPSTWSEHPRPWTVQYGTIVDGNGKTVLSPGYDVIHKDQLLQDVVDSVNEGNE